MTKPKVTARKYMGDDAGSWAVFIDGRPFVTGLTRSEVPYYRKQAAAATMRTTSGLTVPRGYFGTSTSTTH